MSEFDVRDFADEMVGTEEEQERAENNVELWHGKVTAVDTGTVSVAFGGDPDEDAIEDCRYLDSYDTPAEDDVVWALFSGGDILVLGRQAAT
jgi:hypothetical protein